MNLYRLRFSRPAASDIRYPMRQTPMRQIKNRSDSGFRYLALCCLALLLSGCANQVVPRSVAVAKPLPEAVSQPADIDAVMVPVLERQGRLPSLVQSAVAAAKPHYNFHAVGVPIADALRLFARDNELNLVLDRGLQGELTIDFTDLPLELALDALLDAHGYGWQMDGRLIRIRQQTTRTFDVDYLRLRRSSESHNESGAFGVSGSGESTGSNEFEIEQENVVDFWEELTEELAELVGDDGQVVANRTAGLVTVTASKRVVDRMEMYLKRIRQGSMRQVSIDAKIVEVELDETMNLGIDWSSPELLSIGKYDIGRIPLGADGAQTFLTATVGSGTQVILEALQEQGNLNVVSQPKLKVLNNQTAQIRVARDEPYYVQTQAFVPAAGDDPAQPAQFEQQSATIGLVVQVTPSVSADGWITLEISPVITRKLSQIGFPETDAGGNVSFSGNVGPPIIDVKQTSAVVRVRSGQTAVIGGLIQQTDNEIVNKVPLLGDLPLVGAAFRDTTTVHDRNELVIMITPTAEFIETDQAQYAW